MRSWFPEECNWFVTPKHIVQLYMIRNIQICGEREGEREGGERERERDREICCPNWQIFHLWRGHVLCTFSTVCLVPVNKACTSQKTKAVKIKCNFHLNSSKVNAFFRCWCRLQYDFSCTVIDLHWKWFYTDGLISKVVFFLRIKKTPVDTRAKLIFNSNSCNVMNIVENQCTWLYCTNQITQYQLYINIKDVSPCCSASVPSSGLTVCQV